MVAPVRSSYSPGRSTSPETAHKVVPWPSHRLAPGEAARAKRAALTTSAAPRRPRSRRGVRAPRRRPRPAPPAPSACVPRRARERQPLEHQVRIALAQDARGKGALAVPAHAPYAGDQLGRPPWPSSLPARRRRRDDGPPPRSIGRASAASRNSTGVPGCGGTGGGCSGSTRPRATTVSARPVDGSHGRLAAAQAPRPRRRRRRARIARPQAAGRSLAAQPHRSRLYQPPPRRYTACRDCRRIVPHASPGRRLDSGGDLLAQLIEVCRAIASTPARCAPRHRRRPAGRRAPAARRREIVSLGGTIRATDGAVPTVQAWVTLAREGAHELIGGRLGRRARHPLRLRHRRLRRRRPRRTGQAVADLRGARRAPRGATSSPPAASAPTPPRRCAPRAGAGRAGRRRLGLVGRAGQRPRRRLSITRSSAAAPSSASTATTSS